MLIHSDKRSAPAGQCKSFWARPLAALAMLVIGIASGRLCAAEPIPVEYLWQSDPALGVPWFRPVEEYSPSAKPEQIQSPSASQRMEAAQAIVRAADDGDFDKPALHQAIWKRLEAGESQPNVRAELVAAFCTLDDGSASEQLWRILGDDLLVRPTLEKACIKWRKPQPLEMWRTRLREHQGSQSELERALEGLGTVGTQEDLALLTQAVTDATEPATLRLVAAQAIGRLSSSSQLPLAKQLHESTALHADLLAIAVLGKQDGDETRAFIADIAERGEPLAQRHAYQWMCELDPVNAKAKAAAYAEHADAEIRRLSILQINQTDSSEALTLLARALSDENSSLRKLAREELLARSSRSAEHRQALEATLPEGLKQSDWKALEQYVRLTVELEQTSHIPQLLELLDNPRPEVCITAAWALRRLAIEESTLAAMFAHAQQLVKRLQEAPDPGSGIEEFERRRVAHLLEAFGQRQYEPAKETLLLFVPKNQQRMGLVTRMAGIWACGKIFEREGNRALADELCARIADKSSMFPEPEGVRYAATLALGWLADSQTREALVTYNEDKPLPIGYATEWALGRIDERSKSAQ